MGYTHYWKKNRSMTVVEWNSICADSRKVLALQLVKNTAPSKVSAAAIVFNGAGENAYETFHLACEWGDPTDRAIQVGREEDFDFCKTGNRPYDAVVCAILAIAANHCAALKVTSDGEWSDWAPGLELCGLAGVKISTEGLGRLHAGISRGEGGPVGWPTLPRWVSGADPLLAWVVAEVYGATPVDGARSVAVPLTEGSQVYGDGKKSRKRITKRALVVLVEEWEARAKKLDVAGERDSAAQLRLCAEDLRETL